jgi:hypothetical protein
LDTNDNILEDIDLDTKYELLDQLLNIEIDSEIKQRVTSKILSSISNSSSSLSNIQINQDLIEKAVLIHSENDWKEITLDNETKKHLLYNINNLDLEDADKNDVKNKLIYSIGSDYIDKQPDLEGLILALNKDRSYIHKDSSYIQIFVDKFKDKIKNVFPLEYIEEYDGDISADILRIFMNIN